MIATAVKTRPRFQHIIINIAVVVRWHYRHALSVNFTYSTTDMKNTDLKPKFHLHVRQILENTGVLSS